MEFTGKVEVIMFDWLRRLAHPKKFEAKKSSTTPTSKGRKTTGAASSDRQRSNTCANSFSSKEKGPILVRGEFWKNTAEDRWDLPRENDTHSDLSVEGLVKRLGRMDRAEIRRTAAEELGRSGSAAIPAIPVLVNSAVDKDATVREAALNALNAIDPSWPKRAEVQKSIPNLVVALSGQPSDVIRTAAKLLSDIGPTAIPSLAAALSSDEDTVNNVYVLRVLARIGPSAASAVPGIAKALGSRYLQVRIAAAKALAVIGPTEATISALIAGLADSYSNAREAMAACLGQAGVMAQPAIPALLPLLADRNHKVRKAAAEALERIGPGAVPALTEIVKTRDHQRLKAWAKTITEVSELLEKPKHDMMVTDPLKAHMNLIWAAYDILEEQACLEIAQEAALQVLGKLGPAASSSVAVVSKALEDPNPRIRLAAIQAIGQIGPTAPTAENVVPDLVRTLVDSDNSFRDAAAQAVKNFDHSRLSEPLVTEAIKDISEHLEKPGELGVQAFAAIGIASVPILVKVLESGSRIARENAARTLGLIGPEAQDAVPMLTKALQDSHPWVQTEAAKALEQIDARTAIPTETLQQISQVRRDSPHLTVHMSDEEIADLLQQTEKSLRVPSDLSGMKAMSAHECGAHGVQLLEEGRWQEAERFFLAQLEKGEQETDLDQQAKAYNSLAHLRCYRGDRVQAMILYRKALAHAERIDNQRLIGTIYYEIGEVYRMQGDHGQAVEYYNKSLDIATIIGNEQSLAIAYGNLGIVYKNQGQFERAIEAYEKSLQYSTKLGIDRLTANQYGNLGVVYLHQGRYTLAVEMHQKSLEICLRLGNQKAIADQYGNLGIAYQVRGNYPSAVGMYLKALDIMQSLGDEPGSALIYGNLAVVYNTVGNVGQAIAYYNKALKILERIGDKRNAAKFHNNLGLLYKQQGQSPPARIHLQKAQALFETVGDKQAVLKVSQELHKL